MTFKRLKQLLGLVSNKENSSKKIKNKVKANPKAKINEETPGLVPINKYTRPFEVTGTGILFPDGSIQTSAQGGSAIIDPGLSAQVQQNTADIAKNAEDIAAIEIPEIPEMPEIPDPIDAYTKAETYNTTEIDGKLFEKADKTDTYTKAEVDAIAGSGGGESGGGESGGIEEAPSDGKQYARQDKAWTEVMGGMPPVLRFMGISNVSLTAPSGPEEGDCYINKMPGKPDASWTGLDPDRDIPANALVVFTFMGQWIEITSSEVDPVFQASAASGISQADIDKWNETTGGSGGGGGDVDLSNYYTKDEVDERFDIVNGAVIANYTHHQGTSMYRAPGPGCCYIASTASFTNNYASVVKLYVDPLDADGVTHDLSEIVAGDHIKLTSENGYGNYTVTSARAMDSGAYREIVVTRDRDEDGNYLCDGRVIDGDTVKWKVQPSAAAIGGALEPLKWKDVLSQRQSNTEYIDELDVPLYIRLDIMSEAPGDSAHIWVDGELAGAVGNGNNANHTSYNSIEHLVPAGATYKVNIINGATIRKWAEAKMPTPAAAGGASVQLQSVQRRVDKLEKLVRELNKGLDKRRNK